MVENEYFCFLWPQKPPEIVTKSEIVKYRLIVHHLKENFMLITLTFGFLDDDWTSDEASMYSCDDSAPIVNGVPLREKEPEYAQVAASY